MIEFSKMQGTGNDYLYINGIKNRISNHRNLAVKMCDRHYGVGADGIIFIHESAEADFKMRIFNPDGSEAEMCGNGIRCFAKYVYDYKLTKKTELAIETLSGIRNVSIQVKNKRVAGATVDMGEPVLQRERIPMAGDPGMVINEVLPLDDGMKFHITAVSMGNPHVIIFVEDLDKFPVEKYGPVIENHAFFPKRTNVEFVTLVNEKEVYQRTWERGTGETLSCGTGASAVTVASILNRKSERKITVHLKGGDLTIEWNEKNNRVYMTGPAVEVFTGVWP